MQSDVRIDVRESIFRALRCRAPELASVLEGSDLVFGDPPESRHVLGTAVDVGVDSDSFPNSRR